MFGNRPKRRGATPLPQKAPKPAKPQRAAATPTQERPQQRSFRFRFRPGQFVSWVLRHAQVLVESLGRLWRLPIASAMTAAVIGIALALPAGLHLLLDNLQAVTAGWDAKPRISLFLGQGVKEVRARELTEKLRQEPEVSEVQLITPDEALREFRRHSGFGEALNLLDRNPLPTVLLVTPAPSVDSADKSAALAQRLRDLPEVDLAQVDLEWVERLQAITELVRRGVTAAAVLLGLAVLLVVGNTIRLDILSRRDEIVVIKLIGGTDAFIRRPFLYGGVWYGLLGGAIAWLLVTLALGVITGPVQRLAHLYASDFRLAGLSFGAALALLAIGALLGLLGSWLAVAQHLRQIEPN